MNGECLTVLKLRCDAGKGLSGSLWVRMIISKALTNPVQLKGNLMKKIQFALFLIMAFMQSGCSLFFGNIRPIEEKSKAYEISEFSKNHPNWKKVSQSDHPDEIKDSGDSAVSDIAYQSELTASVISLNSACRENQNEKTRKNLSELSRELLLGISNITIKEEAKSTVGQAPALITTVKGELNHETVMLRTVVVQKRNCVYDLMFVSRPESFKKDEKDFEDFVSSLKLK